MEVQELRWVEDEFPFQLGDFLRSTYHFCWGVCMVCHVFPFTTTCDYYTTVLCPTVSLIPNLQGQETMLRPARRATKGSYFLFNMSQHQTSESSAIYSRVIPTKKPKDMGPLSLYGKFPIVFLYL